MTGDASGSRRDQIAAYVTQRGEVRIDELAATFGVSRMTIHRHVEDLAHQGVLRKLHGAVSAQPSGVYESLFTFRQTRAPAAKQALAQAAMAEIEPGQAVLLDDSTTAGALGAFLPQVTPVTVITNSLGLIQMLAGVDGIDLIALGGDYHPTYNAFIGPLMQDALAGLRVNIAICSASAIAGGAALIQDAQVTRAKQAMLAAAARRVLLVDSSKFGAIALHKMADLNAFDAVYADDALAPETVSRLRDTGVALKLVPLT
ncbi:MAG: DeoR/GlpR transcriptional regulator [Rhizobiales bacterium]|nr:DeoR/GlpR transcriptional regulator [Hyphomicrobiales bacterium]OJY01339.1 MAG: DeoR family transcriptional regulator [Rhizobiales bacterium 63-22]